MAVGIGPTAIDPARRPVRRSPGRRRGADAAAAAHRRGRGGVKVAAIHTHVVSCTVERPFTSARGLLHTTLACCLVELQTDDGIVGWGECRGPAAALKTVVDTLLAPRVIGRDPFDVGAIWEDLYDRVKDHGRAGLPVAGIAGIDIALWDVLGRALGLPVHKLIGGAHRSELVACAAGLHFTDPGRLVEEAVEEADGYAGQGFRAIRMSIGVGDLKADAARVAAVRRTIGPGILLAVDANHCFSVANAIRLGRMLEAYDVLRFGEPVGPEDRKGCLEVARALDMAVAGGGNECTRWGFRDIVAERAMDIIQPDPCAAGGFSECLKIAALASAHGVECAPHACGSAIGLAATVQLLAALADQPPAWRPIAPLLEIEQTPDPLRDRLAFEPIAQRDGLVRVPDLPGIGIEIDRDVLMQFKTA